MSSQVIYPAFGRPGRAQHAGGTSFDSIGKSPGVSTLPTWLRVNVDVSHSDVVTRHRYPRPDENPADLDAYRAWLPSRVESGDYVGYLAQIDGVIVAGAGITMLNWGPTRGSEQNLRARLVNVFTEVQYRRRGLARELASALILACYNRGIEQIDLGTSDVGNLLWAALGFEADLTGMTLRL